MFKKEEKALRTVIESTEHLTRVLKEALETLPAEGTQRYWLMRRSRYQVVGGGLVQLQKMFLPIWEKYQKAKLRQYTVEDVGLNRLTLVEAGSRREAVEMYRAAHPDTKVGELTTALQGRRKSAVEVRSSTVTPYRG